VAPTKRHSTASRTEIQRPRTRLYAAPLVVPAAAPVWNLEELTGREPAKHSAPDERPLAVRAGEAEALWKFQMTPAERQRLAAPVPPDPYTAPARPLTALPKPSVERGSRLVEAAPSYGRQRRGASLSAALQVAVGACELGDVIRRHQSGDKPTPLRSGLAMGQTSTGKAARVYASAFWREIQAVEGWEGVLLSVLLNAKVAIEDWRNGDLGEDPRGLHLEDGIPLLPGAGTGRAHPHWLAADFNTHVTQLGLTAPPWATHPMFLRWAVKVVGFQTGGGADGQIASRTFLGLLRDPHALAARIDAYGAAVAARLAEALPGVEGDVEGQVCRELFAQLRDLVLGVRLLVVVCPNRDQRDQGPLREQVAREFRSAAQASRQEQRTDAGPSRSGIDHAVVPASVFFVLGDAINGWQAKKTTRPKAEQFRAVDHGPPVQAPLSVRVPATHECVDDTWEAHE
jgi:hypothetical protein